MKKQLLLTLLLSITSQFNATPIKRRLARVEEGINFLAHDANQSWKAIAQINAEITELERKIYKKLTHPKISKAMKSKCIKDKFR